jgi:hypothetical protein
MLQGGEDFFKDTGDDFSKGGRSSFRESPSERSPMIEKIFKEVLGRKPSSRELSFYKYGVMKGEEIRIKLLKSEEHKKLLEDARKLPKVENDLKNSQTSEKRLTQKIEDIGEEVRQSKILLEEKNDIIHGLREELNNPYDLPNKVQKFEEGFDVYQTTGERYVEKEEKMTVKDRIKEILDILLK